MRFLCIIIMWGKMAGVHPELANWFLLSGFVYFFYSWQLKVSLSFKAFP